MDAFEAKKRIDALPAEQQQVEWKKFMETHPGDAHRIVLGRARDESTGLKMKDRKGRDRLVMRAADGSPVIQFLDESGKVVSQLPAAKSQKKLKSWRECVLDPGPCFLSRLIESLV